jgi:hypothetical protein
VIQNSKKQKSGKKAEHDEKDLKVSIVGMVGIWRRNAMESNFLCKNTVEMSE